MTYLYPGFFQEHQVPLDLAGCQEHEGNVAIEENVVTEEGVGIKELKGTWVEREIWVKREIREEEEKRGMKVDKSCRICICDTDFP